MWRSSPIRLVLVTVTLSAPVVAQTPPATTAATPAAAAKKAGPNPYSAAIQKGDAAYLAHDFDGAIAAYQQEIAKNPNSALGNYRLGEAQLAKGNMADAEQAWQTALRLAAKDVVLKGKVLFLLADLKERQKAYDEAVEHWKAYAAHVQAEPGAKGFPATAAERIKRVDEWKKISADAAEVKARIEKRIQAAAEESKKNSQ